jgi:hypothetical protein
MEKKVLPNQQVKVLTEALQKATEANQAQAKELAFLRPLVGERNTATARPSGIQEIQKAPRIPGAELRKQISSHVLELMRRAQDLDALAAEIGPLSEPAERMLSRLFYNSERKHF